HASSNGGKGLGDGSLALNVTRAFYHLLHLLDGAGRLLDADEVWVLGELDDQRGGNVVAGGLGKVVDDDRQGRAVAHETVEGQHVLRVGHLSFVVVRGADHCDIVSDVVGELGEAQGFDGGLDAGSSDEHLVVRGRIAGGLQGFAALG